MIESTAFELDADLPLMTAELAIVRPGTARPTGWVITLAGPAHPKTLAYQNLKQRDRLHKAAQQEQAQVNGRKYKAEERTPEEELRDNVRWVVSRIVGWTPVRLGGQDIVFSDAAAEELFAKPEMGAYFQQIVEFLTAERAFMPRSAAS